MLTNEELEREIKKFAASESDVIKITRYEEIEGEDARMYYFNCNDEIDSFAIVYNDGTVFLSDDWDRHAPENKAGYERICWITPEGQEAIMYNGMPRLLF